MEIQYGNPVTGKRLERVQAFLSTLGLDWEKGIQATVILEEGGEIIATGSRDHNVLKCLGVSPRYQGEGLAAKLISELIKDAFRAGYQHLLVFTNPTSAAMLRNLGFYDIAATDDVVLLENKRHGIEDYVNSLKRPYVGNNIGCIVANCNPFTNGHLYLIEQAASKCDLLYLFILSEQRSRFPSHDRMELAQASTKHLRNVVVSPTSAYLISSATFPDYFIKDKLRSSNINCKLDIIIFATKIALPLGINMRFVGTEPYCQVTKSYNEQMKSILPVYGIELVELPRCEISGRAVSASMVRELFDQGKMNEIQQFVPNATYKYLKKVWQ